jgi:D-alanine-D-alanine ligase
VDFFVTYENNAVVLNEVNTLPGFTSISMYPKLFAASGIPYSELIDELLKLALEAQK